jgi:hypothetical protein
MKDSYFVNLYKTPLGVPYAVSMRADYTAEHQGGIDDLLLAVGGRPNGDGLSRYRVSFGSGQVMQVREGHVYGWRVGRKSKLRATLLIGDPSDLNPSYIVEVADRDKNLNGTWDRKNFILSARDAESVSFLREIASEAQAGNVLVYQGMNPVDPISGGCLMLLIEDRAPQEHLDTIIELQKRNAA